MLVFHYLIKITSIIDCISHTQSNQLSIVVVRLYRGHALLHVRDFEMKWNIWWVFLTLINEDKSKLEAIE